MSDKSSQPQIIQLSSLPTNTAQRVESDVLEPLTFSDTEAVWEFAPKGFLHPASTLTLGFEDNTEQAGSFPFVNIGIHSCVRRAVLRTTAGRVICDCDDWNYLQSTKSMFLHNSTNKEREQYLNGRSIDFQMNYLLNPAAAAGLRFSNQTAQGYGLDNGLDFNCVAGDVLEGLSVQPHLEHSAGSTLQIKLHDLFPYMKSGNQIPLFLLPNERIQVQLFWADAVQRIGIPATADAGYGALTTAQKSIVLDKTKCKIVSDHTFYDNEIMENIRDQYDKGKTFEYVDYRLSKQSLTNAQVNSVQQLNIGGAGMVVNNVVYGWENPNNNAQKLCGKYSNVGGRVVGVSVEALHNNLYVNGEFLHQTDNSNSAVQFHNLKEAEGMVPFVSRQLYSGQGINGLGTTKSEMEGRSLVSELGGQFFTQGFNLSGLNQRVDQLGIEIKNKVHLPDISADAVSTYTQRAWLEIRRYLIIKDGHLECYYV